MVYGPWGTVALATSVWKDNYYLVIPFSFTPMNIGTIHWYRKEEGAFREGLFFTLEHLWLLFRALCQWRTDSVNLWITRKKSPLWWPGFLSLIKSSMSFYFDCLASFNFALKWAYQRQRTHQLKDYKNVEHCFWFKSMQKQTVSQRYKKDAVVGYVYMSELVSPR